MTTTPVWVPLLVAGLGLVGTAGAGLGGVFLTQRRSDNREITSWTRQTDRENARWRREDEARTFELRRASYVAFFDAANRITEESTTYHFAWTVAPDRVDLFNFPTMDEIKALQNMLNDVRVYGTASLSEAAIDVFAKVFQLQLHVSAILIDGVEPPTEASINKFSDVARTSVSSFLAKMRDELRIPSDAPDGPERY